MSARETILARIRDAHTLAPPVPVEVPRSYRVERHLDDAELLDLLADRLEDYRAVVRRCTVRATPDTVADLLAGSGARRVGVPAGLDRGWLAAFDGEVMVDSGSVSPADLDDLDGVVTGCAVASAETGTIFLDAGPAQGRRALTLVPDLHVCVVARAQVVVGVPESVDRLVPGRPTTLVSGPSATSDIELERVEGVHGPRTLLVVLQTDA